MPGCVITSGINVDCKDLRVVGGVKKRAYIFNISELQDEKYTQTSGYVSAINFLTYGGLYAFVSRARSHSGGSTVTTAGPGANTYFQHDAIVKLFPDGPTEDQAIQDLVVAEVGLILEDNNQRFFLYGGFNGLEVTEGTQNTGQESASDIAYSLTFTGEEKEVPKRISVDGTGTDYAATKAYLDSLIV